MRLKLLFSESIRSLGANLSTTVAATMTVLIGMFLLGLFIALGSWAQAFGDHQKEKLLVKVYFCTDSTCKAAATDKQINAVRAKLDADPLVKEVAWVPKAEALDRMRKLQPEIVENLPGNPLPDAFEVTPVDGENAKEIGRNLPRPSCPPAWRRSTTAASSPTRRHGRTRALDGLRDRDDRLADLVRAPDREHDPALDLLPQARDRGDEARGRDELVRPRAVHARGADLRRARSPRSGAPAPDRQGGRARADHKRVRRQLRGRGVVVSHDRVDLVLVGLTVGAVGSGITLRRFLQV